MNCATRARQSAGFLSPAELVGVLRCVPDLGARWPHRPHRAADGRPDPGPADHLEAARYVKHMRSFLLRIRIPKISVLRDFLSSSP